MSDLAGNDIGWHIRKRRYVEQPEMIYSRVADKLCELGRFGQKTKRAGTTTSPAIARRCPSPVVDELIAKHRAEIGVTPRARSTTTRSSIGCLLARQRRREDSRGEDRRSAPRTSTSCT